MKRFEGILFDMDGVLIDSEPIHIQKWREVLKVYGIETIVSWFDKFVGVPDEEVASEIVKKYELNKPPHELLEEKRLKYRQFIEFELPSSPQLIEAISSLQHYKLAVVTASKKSDAELITCKIGVNALFQVILGGDEIQNNKPSPEIYLKAIEELGISPNTGIAVEDSTPGVQAAKNAGLYVIGIKNSMVQQNLKTADHICDNIYMAIQHINSLN